MPSLTPLHETYCKWDRRPPSQADVLEGLAQLVSTSLLGVHDIVQLIYTEVLKSTFGLNDKQSTHFLKKTKFEIIQKWSYGAIQKYGRYFLAPSLRKVVEQFPNLYDKPLTPTLHFLVGVLNGVLGDYLVKHQNPLTLPMVLYDHYGELQQGDISGRVVIFVHGLCMNHTDWSNRKFSGIGERLLAQRDHNTMLYLNYNTGRRISANGRSLSNVLEDFVRRNPNVTSLDLIGHSMGGLVCRSALFYSKQSLYNWIQMVDNLVCIGSPHHGAALERFGFSLQEQLGSYPLVKLIRHLVNIRSNGILDLRHGSVRDDDWEYLQARIGEMDDNRKPAPLPTHINTFFIAGTVEHENAKQNKALRIIGDYLVSIKSALGEHPNPRFQLKLPDTHKAIFYGLNHFEIQYHSSVAEQITHWLYPEHSDYAQHGVQTHMVNLSEQEQSQALQERHKHKKSDYPAVHTDELS